MTMKRFLLALVIVATGCVPKAPRTKLASGPPEHWLLYEEGLRAFKEGTPEGYLRSSNALRRAASLSPSRCEYSLHLAEALLRLALEQKSNYDEKWDQPAIEAKAAIGAAEAREDCKALPSLMARVRAMSLGPQFVVGRLTDARNAINNALEIDPQDPMNWLVVYELGSRDARQPLQKAADLAPDLPIVQYTFGNSQLEQKTFPEARKTFQHVIAINPRHFRSYLGQAYTYGEDVTDEIEGLYKKVVEIEPNFLRGHVVLGDYYASLEEDEKAADSYRESAKRNSKYYSAFLSLGAVLLRNSKLDEAEPNLRHVIELDLTKPQPPYNAVDFAADSQAHYLLGNLWFERNDIAKAKSEYELAMKTGPGWPDPVYAMGLALQREGRIDDALARFDNVIRLAPSHADAFKSRGGIRFDRQQYREAIADFSKAVTLYQMAIAEIEAEARKAESANLLRKALSARRRLVRVEQELETVREAKKKAEALVGPGN